MKWTLKGILCNITKRYLLTLTVSSIKFITRAGGISLKGKPLKNASEFCYCLRKMVNSHPSRIALLQLAEDHPRIIVFYNYDYELDKVLN